ncbi:WXG100 family type VII secretion target [Mycobacterium parmense]|uniref:ESAT-6-like protein n=1 Tax=Mycobacterium parmense TaxID=185642 RepID=A0A7I7YXE5_9MYCO|nr:WXG100 family type VII secretion target [Mycobacterium parmense]MCV7350597.1 WXG100 family type VII secretion target [Mycobacterium parmense]ORW48309.1 secretion protein [Mycobacterium parmense]BBZ45977.1 ESAT-6-like protein EsxF [Mycobacterium parmense]
MAGDNTLRVDPHTLRWSAAALSNGAEELRNRLTDLDDRVGALLGGWRGASGSAYGSAWELWHRGAGEVEAGLAILGRLVAEAGGAYQENETTSALRMRLGRSETDRG